MRPEIFCTKKRGERHVSRRMNCQDHFSVSRLGGALILAVSDGHSSCPRSGMGSRIACLAFQRAVASGCTVDELAGAVKDRYDRFVAKDLLRRPLTGQELSALEGRTPETAYGATLLGAVLTEEWTLLFRLGDGWVTAIRCDGTPFPELEADPDCFQDFTSSLCYPRGKAIAHSRCAFFHEPCGALILATDGYSARGTLPLPLLTELANAAALRDTLPQVLEKGANGDDQTAVILRRGGIAEDEAFRAGLASVLDAAQRSKRIRALRREKSELRAYLTCAAETAQRMHTRRDAGLDVFLEKVRIRTERYHEVCRMLEELSND